MKKLSETNDRGGTYAWRVLSSADGSVVSAGGSKKVTIWERKADDSMRLLHTLPSGGGESAMAMSRDGTMVAYTGSDKKNCIVASVSTGGSCTLWPAIPTK